MGSCGCSGGMKDGKPCSCANCMRKYSRPMLHERRPWATRRRWISGQNFYLTPVMDERGVHSLYDSKDNLNMRAEALRNKGFNARIIPLKFGFTLWVSDPKDQASFKKRTNTDSWVNYPTGARLPPSMIPVHLPRPKARQRGAFTMAAQARRYQRAKDEPDEAQCEKCGIALPICECVLEEWAKIPDVCECIRCKPHLNRSWDWCYEAAAHISESGEIMPDAEPACDCTTTDMSGTCVDCGRTYSKETRYLPLQRGGKESAWKVDSAEWPKRITYDDGNKFVLTGFREESGKVHGIYQVEGFDADTMRTMSDTEIDLDLETSRTYERAKRSYNHLQWWSPGNLKIIDKNVNSIDDRVE